MYAKNFFICWIHLFTYFLLTSAIGPPSTNADVIIEWSLTDFCPILSKMVGTKARSYTNFQPLLEAGAEIVKNCVRRRSFMHYVRRSSECMYVLCSIGLSMY